MSPSEKEDSIEFDGLGQRKAGVGGSAARRHDPLAPEPLDFHETSIEFDPTCDLVVVFPVPLHEVFGCGYIALNGYKTVQRCKGLIAKVKLKWGYTVPEDDQPSCPADSQHNVGAFPSLFEPCVLIVRRFGGDRV
ncbi:hypothetical protein TREMEDRAFT_60706 [Tremella mesenterica DSM 1558]|uniref:uncharacterized protein n=1 Tax=Tremella mesenterica (strain ATCC 24925 / CBS 8224 / DSM 1558 / NBRC 9311 / NRRL Y-6157 / RJB 2259-6 / UBC 559-6) TaxID=578456 RepID=UPI0003F4951F|nr:uncharacterized protein TREMEDRAFT_60706 [Tremella mesenterica DSM 1558]EIW71790.1 hypothetical protein TREMEDRAFT_60706 [Tremella mesenterica DSM 1558]